MDNFEKCLDSGNEILKIEDRLREEDFSDYSAEALDFEKSEFTKVWTKYKKAYDECSSEEGKEKKFLAIQTKHKDLADDEEKSFPIGAKILREAMYVDDALVGAHSIEEALEARDQLIGILKTAMFDLRKWTSNTKEILEDLPLEDLLSSSFVCLEEDSRAKMLGVRWNAASDSNRVSSILSKVGNIEWRHVVSNCNPADLATRGLTPSELKDNKLWWHGPEWLILDENNWPSGVTEFQTSSEEKRSQSMFAKSSEIADSSLKVSGGKPEETEKVTGDSGEPLKAKEKPKVQDFLSNISTFQKAIHVVARMYRFVSLARKSDSNPEMLSSGELSMARKGIFIWSQKQYFSKDYASLTAKTRLSPKSPLICLNPFLDQAGIIRANGRLGSTTCLTYNERHPVILAYESRIARLYVEFVHKITCHGGIRLVMTTVRLECWVIRLKSLVKSVIHNCKVCVLHRQKLMQQIMSVLPPERTTLSRAFTNTGVDFAGPFEIKSFTGRYSRITKGYVCLFVCFATKAIHLEAVSDLSTPAFLAALDRFVARRGCPNSMYSDNGRNFVGAARQIDSNFAQQVKSFKDEAVNKFGHQRLSWHFIPAAAPHMGGLWESGVKSFKTHFKKLSGQLKYTFEEFSTLLATIEACLNSRPLGSMSEDVEDLQALTPAHFLIGSSMLTPAEPEEIKPVSSIFNRWRKLKAIHHDICRRWKEEYLVELHKRYKWKNPHSDLIVGDLVALKGESLCSTDWRLGRIVKVYHGSDDKVRVVDLKTQGGIITRPIHKLVLLPRSSQI
ncbi:uncharacterized protein LOC133327612 [Musca vetustissima]|uniref:uncharacterized protein LOC133327612 n=1 Tax=Musca vetustissima TaxID=27455 RepID=UPI002AB734A2|nr:uncharacterized protein LOC133327612 [Musca vetustissima]